MRIDGGCHCGHIRYEAEVDPEKVSICHCTDCQTLTGTAYRVTVPAAKETFRLTGGKPKIYVKTAESGNKRWHGFCPECGTPIYSTAPTEDPASYGLRVGTARQRAELPPKVQSWCRSAAPWSMNIESLPKNQKGAAR
ncbi:MAG TPA: GFA family protein [Burkholderiales bacterium]|nr:GFA family protein [Burkholderiales bacterium]